MRKCCVMFVESLQTVVYWIATECLTGTTNLQTPSPFIQKLLKSKSWESSLIPSHIWPQTSYPLASCVSFTSKIYLILFIVTKQT